MPFTVFLIDVRSCMHARGQSGALDSTLLRILSYYWFKAKHSGWGYSFFDSERPADNKAGVQGRPSRKEELHDFSMASYLQFKKSLELAIENAEKEDSVERESRESAIQMAGSESAAQSIAWQARNDGDARGSALPASRSSGHETLADLVMANNDMEAGLSARARDPDWETLVREKCAGKSTKPSPGKGGARDWDEGGGSCGGGEWSGERARAKARERERERERASPVQQVRKRVGVEPIEPPCLRSSPSDHPCWRWGRGDFSAAPPWRRPHRRPRRPGPPCPPPAARRRPGRLRAGPTRRDRPRRPWPCRRPPRRPSPRPTPPSSSPATRRHSWG